MLSKSTSLAITAYTNMHLVVMIEDKHMSVMFILVALLYFRDQENKILSQDQVLKMNFDL